MPLLLEHWKAVVGYEGLYEVLSSGNIRKANGRYLKLTRSGGYRIVTLIHEGIERSRKAHRLVLAAFLGPSPKGLVVNHVDGCKHNNRVSNLEYVTQKENFRHAVRIGLNPAGMKLSDDDVRVILKRVLSESPTALAKEYGVSRGLINGLRHGYQQIRATDHL